jgi:hypothetical protein
MVACGLWVIWISVYGFTGFGYMDFSVWFYGLWIMWISMYGFLRALGYMDITVWLPAGTGLWVLPAHGFR